MTPEERQALREKHRRKKFVDGYGCRYCAVRIEYEDDEAYNWPCDVIRVLDATEPPALEL